MHDWWFALCAASCGQLLHVPEATVLYRQHAANKVGALSRWQLIRGIIADPTGRWHRAIESFERGLAQASDLRARIENLSDCDPNARELLEAYDSLFRTVPPGMNRLRRFNRLGVKRQDTFTNVLLKLMVMFSDPSHHHERTRK
jgi:rhamnosyltransferase